MLTICLAAPVALVAAQEPAPAPAPGAPAPGQEPAPTPEPQPGTAPPPAGTPAPTPDPGPAQGAPGNGQPPPDSTTPPPDSTTPPTGSSTFVSTAGSASVSILDGSSQSAFRFSPSSITVSVDATVTWTNDGDAPHNVTGDGLGSPTLNNGQSYSHRFTSPGTVSYICSIHPFMKGTVIVQGTSSGGSGSSGSTGTSPPPDVSGSSSESQAVTSPDAAGTSSQLPSTGMPVLPLLIGGGALLIGGALLRRGTRAI